MRKKKIAIVGSGNAGCLTALHYGFYGNELFDIDLYHDPNIAIEKVGQGSAIPTIKLISDALGFDWVNNPIKATFKSGIFYENWGKKNHNFFHKFPMYNMAFHYIPKLLSNVVMESKFVNTIEKSISDPESEIDADYIFDCRGKTKNNYKNDYDIIINPLNSAILSRKYGRDVNLTYTRCVATPDGWTFVIPNYDSVSYGYLYNNTITTKNQATKNFIDLFDVVPDGDLNFKNYISKSMWVGSRTILNGNRLSFIEPLEATSSGVYQYVARSAWDHIVDGVSKDICDQRVKSFSKKIQTFIMWHYQNGSKYDSPFWEYAKSLPFNPDDEFLCYLKNSKDFSYFDINNTIHNDYGQWPLQSFKNWYDNVASGEK